MTKPYEIHITIKLMKRQYVIAGNYEQYLLWIRERGLDSSEWVYVSNGNTIRGLRNPGGRLIGTWYERKDAFDILTVLTLSSDKANKNLEKALLLWTEWQTRKVVSTV